MKFEVMCAGTWRKLFLRGMIVSLSFPFSDAVKYVNLSPTEASGILLGLSGIARIASVTNIADISFVNLALKQAGGKGGFGKLLKSQKHLGKNTTNFESCRDLEGRKLKKSRREQKIEELKSKESQSSKDVKVEISEPKSAVMLDDKYINQLSMISKEKESAVADGLKAVSSETSKPAEPVVRKMKKTLFDDDDDDSE
jgi:hypothetical protein